MDSTRETNPRRRVLTIVILMLALLPFQSEAQQEAGILGQVTDDSGAVLPGVTVTATSPALQVPQVDRRHQRDAANTAWRRCRSAPTPWSTSSPVSRPSRQEQLRLTARVPGASRRPAEGRHARRDGHRVGRRAGGGRDLDDRPHAADAGKRWR